MFSVSLIGVELEPTAQSTRLARLRKVPCLVRGGQSPVGLGFIRLLALFQTPSKSPITITTAATATATTIKSDSLINSSFAYPLYYTNPRPRDRPDPLNTHTKTKQWPNRHHHHHQHHNKHHPPRPSQQQ